MFVLVSFETYKIMSVELKALYHTEVLVSWIPEVVDIRVMKLQLGYDMWGYLQQVWISTLPFNK